MNLNAIKKSLKLMGIDLEQTIQMVNPAIKTWLDNELEKINEPLQEDEIKAFLLSEYKNEYYLMPIIIKKEAKEHIKTFGLLKISDSINKLLKQANNG